MGKMKTKGLSFRKFDLHVHTPASDCFYDKNVTPQQIVDQCLQLGLSAIAITDHNTGDWIDKVKSVAKGRGLTVFPSVEVTVGDAHNHIIAILDVGKTTKDIEVLLIRLEIFPDSFGKKETFSRKSVTEVIEIITGENFNGLAIPAHIDSTNGVFDQMRGNERKKVIQHSKLLSVEAVNYQEVSSLLDGNDPSYKRKLAVYQSSDNPCLDQDGKPDTSGPFSGMHSIDGIGSRYTYFKVDENITLESLRQCFIDPDVRIRQSDVYQESICPYIKSVKISGGFLDNEELVLHCGLNSILGAKGVGKSLLIELIRFALNQRSINTDIAKDHEGKLREKLGQYGKVEIVVSDKTGRDYQIIRTYDPSENNPVECMEPSTNEPINIDIDQLFPVLFLSQMEIMRIAENPKEQMSFIDRYFDFHRFRNQITNMESELEELDGTVAESIRVSKEEKNLLSQKQTLKFEIDRISIQLQNPIFDEYQ